MVPSETNLHFALQVSLLYFYNYDLCPAEPDHSVYPLENSVDPDQLFLKKLADQDPHPFHETCEYMVQNRIRQSDSIDIVY